MMKITLIKRLLNLVLLVLITMASFIPKTAYSEDYDMTNFGGNSATKEDFIKALKPDPEPREGLGFRGLGIGGAKDPLKTESRKAASMGLKFELASYQLTDEAKKKLDQLGLAIQNQELEKYHFLLEGHTDSLGSDEYNLDLSRSRAYAVKKYLISNFQIDPRRLKTIGRGEYDLLDKNNPQNPLNRRVQIVNIQ